MVRLHRSLACCRQRSAPTDAGRSHLSERVRTGSGLGKPRDRDRRRAITYPARLVLMDLQMPGMDGLEATRRIRAAEAGDTRTRIVALTANARTDDHKTIHDADLDGILLKPLDRERLREILEAASKPGANPLAA